MKVFVSSLISGFELLRDAAASAIATLGHVPVRAEDFPASPDSPQTACLAGVRSSEVVVLVLGERYGHVQNSGLSATHEEYREAREVRPVLVFIQHDMTPEPRQAEFIREVQGWEKGHYTADFTDADDLRARVTRALHEYALANEAGPLNGDELVARARELVPSDRQSSEPLIAIAVAGGPIRAVLRPAELESPELRQFLLAEALTGDQAVLTPAVGTDQALKGDVLELTQRDVNRIVRLDESGGLLVVLPAKENRRPLSGISSIIEEDVTATIKRALLFTARVLDHVDPSNRLTHVVPVVAMKGSGFHSWRTREEQERSPNSATFGTRGNDDPVATLNPAIRRRPALVHDAHNLAEDFTVRLRREMI